MLLLSVQNANNISVENPILIIGLTIFVVSVVILLWKNEAKTTI